MHKLCLRIALIGVAMLPLADAQSPMAIQAHVPFRFTVEKTILPAGDYRFRYDSLDHVLSISSVDQNVKSRYAFTFTGTWLVDRGESEHAGPQVLFRCYGESCFLHQVWEDGPSAIEVPETKSEHDLAANKSGKIVAAIAISRK